MTDEKIKQHNFLKILIIFVSLILVFALNFLSMFIVKDKIGLVIGSVLILPAIIVRTKTKELSHSF